AGGHMCDAAPGGTPSAIGGPDSDAFSDCQEGEAAKLSLGNARATGRQISRSRIGFSPSALSIPIAMKSPVHIAAPTRMMARQNCRALIIRTGPRPFINRDGVNAQLIPGHESHSGTIWF